MILHFPKKLRCHISCIFLLLVVLLAENAAGQTTLYSYKTGPWNDLDTWTTDPSGTLLTGSKIPGNNDIVIILSSRTVTLGASVATTGLDVTINSGGILDMMDKSFAALTALRGQGILRLSSVNFPAATINSFVSEGGGTTEYSGVDGILTQTEYNHLKIQKKDNTATNYVVTLGSNVTIHGNFDITRTQGSGIITVTVGNSAATRNIIIEGSLELSSGAVLNTGNFNAIHNISLAGNLTNYGSIDLSNSAQYVAATNGAAVFTFTGESDNNLICDGPADFYRIELNKGTDRTFLLTVTSSNSSYFKLFGPVTNTGGDWNTLPLRLLNGTLRLRSAVNIPILGKDTQNGTIREFHIPGTAGLWIDGATVATSDDGGSWRGITVYGLFRISNGSFTNPNNTGGITYFGNASQPGYILIEGGTVNTTQVKQADVNGRVTYHQTGGIIRITGYSDSRGSSAVFALPTSDFVYIMTGGQIYISGVNTTATNGIDIRVSSSNYNVTGGSVTIVRPSASDDQANFHIYSTAPFYNLTLKDTSLAGTNRNFQLQNDLTVLNNLTVQNRTLDADNFNVTVGGNFNVNAGATYTPGDNTTTFNGTGNQSFAFNGTITSGFNNLTINKSTGTLTFNRTTPMALAVRGSFNLIDGSFADGGNTLNVSGNVTNHGTHTGSGAIALIGTSTQTITSDGTGIFQNLTLNNTSGVAGSTAVSLNGGGITVNGILNMLNNRVFNIRNYNLKLTSSATLAGTFSSDRYISTNGDAGDKGMTVTLNTINFTFPVGTNTPANHYTPAVYSLSAAPSAYGTITVIPVDAEHPNTTEGRKNRSLSLFWRVSSQGFNLGSATISHGYYYQQIPDVVEPIGNVRETEYVAARFNRSTFQWTKGTVNDVDQVNNIVGEPGTGTFLQGVGFIDGDYTAGDDTPDDPFSAVKVYYSYNGGGRWMTATSWSLTGHNTNNPPSQGPGNDDLVIIGDNDSIWLSRTEQCGNLQIETGSVLNVLTYTGSTFSVVTSHPNGNGKIKIGTGSFPNGDFTMFRGPTGGTVEYYSTGSYTLPATSNSSEALTYYRHLILSPASGTTITLPNVNMNIYGNLTVAGASATASVNINSAAARTLDIDGNLTVLSGNLQFLNGASQALSVDNTLTVSSGANFNMSGGTTNNTLVLSGNFNNNGTVNFNNGSSCDITFFGPSSTVLTGTGNTTLRYVTVNKGSSQNTTLTINISGATFSTPTNNWLTLVNGTLRFMRTGNLNITTTGIFDIPSTSGLYVNDAGAVVYLGNANSNNNDVFLNGKLTLIQGTINVGPAAAPAFNNDIEYSASGNSAIDIQGGTLTVNGQIRRSLTATGEVLIYNQSGGTVTINGNNQNAIRAKLEIENAGSVFNMSGGSLYIIRGGGTTFGDLYLRPASSSVSGGTIYFGTQNNGVQNFTLDAVPSLNNITINGNGALNTVMLNVNPLYLNGNLIINNNNSAFNSNNNNIFVSGDFTNNGTYTPGTNTTTFNGATQTIGGTTTTQFYDLVINPSNTVSTANHITVNHNLSLVSGTFSTGTFNVNAKGNVSNSAIHQSNANAGGILLNGTSLQQLSGFGSFGRIELNNAAGARLMNDIGLSQNFLLTNGIFDINQYILILGENADIVGGGFGISKMIKPDGVLSNIGIRKHFAAGSHTFTYPIGLTGKYTPAELTFSNSSSGSIRINVINDHHPTVTDPNNVLQYYWEVESSSGPGYDGKVVFNYSNGDVRGTESDYIAARLIIPPGTDWSKASPGPTTDNVDENLNTILFQFPSGTTNIGGEYTAGRDAAIPDEVPVYISKSDGEWDDINIWNPVAPAGGPNGFIVIISTGDSVTTNGNKRFAYRTTINGVLNVGTSYGHNLGHVNGTGKLYLEGPTLPAGRFISFFGCSGGTLEFGGSSDYTIVADRLDTIRNLYFTGTGTRTLPDKNLVICNLLKIDGPALDNSQFNRSLTLFGGIMRKNTGSFSSGTGANASLVFKGTSSQQIGGSNGNFTGSNSLNNLEINNSQGLVLNGPQELKRNLMLINGVITTTQANMLSMINWNTSVVPAGGSASSYVSGPLSKRIFEGDNFSFPTGKGSRYGKVVLNTVGDGTWVSEYFNTGFTPSTVTAPLTTISTNEYWHIIGPAGKLAYVRLRWDAQSDITPLTTQNGISDIRVAEYNTGTSSWEEKNTSASGDDYDGIAETVNKMNLDEHDFTLAAVSSLKSRASFVNTADICAGNNLQVSFSKTAGSYTFTYTINGVAHPVTTAANPYTFAANTTGRYRITAFTGGVVDTNTVLVLPMPTATLTSDEADNTICEGESVTFTAGGGVQYSFRINGVIVQNGASATYSTTLLENGDVVSVNVTNASGCSSMSSSITMTVHNLPVPSLSGLQAVCEGESQVYTTDNTAGISNYTWVVTGGSFTGGATNQISVTWDAVLTAYEDELITVNYTDNNGCTALNPSELDVRVYRVPQTGPSYYIPN